MNINSMDLNLLLVFHSLFETKSVSMSARHLGLSQPAISNALNRLRITFSDELFIRSTKGMIPTGRAKDIFPNVQNILHILETKVLSNENFNLETSQKTFNICATDNEILTYINSLICEEKVSKSALKFKLTFPKEIDFFSNMENGKVDLSFGVDIPKRQNFEIQNITFKGYKCLSMTKLSQKNKIPLKLFLDKDHILVSPLGGNTGAIDIVLDKMSKKRNISLILPSFSLVPDFLQKRDFIITLPETIAKKFSRDYGFYIYDLPFEVPKVQIQMIWHKNLSCDPSHIWLRNNIYEKLKNL